MERADNERETYQCSGMEPASSSCDWDELQSLIDRITDAGQAAHACRILCTRLGFDHYHLNLSIPVALGQPARIALNSLPQAWQSHYSTAGYHTMDPVLDRANRCTVPFFWDDVEREQRGHRAFFCDAKRFGIGFGLTFPFAAPLNTSGFLSFARPAALPFGLVERRELASNAMWFVVRILEAARTYALRSVGVDVSAAALLTKRERECLALSGDGYTTAQIGKLLKITPRTVAFHIDRCVVKLRVHSRRAAFRRALLLGEIELRPPGDREEGSGLIQQLAIGDERERLAREAPPFLVRPQ